jgi:hypothetical protein
MRNANKRPDFDLRANTKPMLLALLLQLICIKFSNIGYLGYNDPMPGSMREGIQHFLRWQESGLEQ